MAGCQNYLKRTLLSINNLKNVDIFPRIKCVLTPQNYLYVNDYIDYFVNLGICNIQFVQYGRSHYKHNDELFLSVEHKLLLHDVFEEIKLNYKHIEIIFQDDLSTGRAKLNDWESWDNRAVCTGGRASLNVMPNGDVTLCEQIPHHVQYVVGNILNETLETIWNGNKLFDLLHPDRKNYYSTPCYSCNTFDECHTNRGYCYRESLFAYGTIYTAPPNCPRQIEEPLRLI